ncbi:MAG: signal peptidase II [Oscillospiraceae bacterium]|nr:signal peptidase II [[Eubacterium] saphenum]
MKIKNYLQYIWLLFAAAMVGIDRLTKWLVVTNMKEKGTTINLIKFGDTEVLNLYYCENNGAAWSTLSGKTILLIVITSIVILGLLFLMVTKRVKRPVYMAAVSLIIGGGIGNLIDRIFNDGNVVDFIDFRIINFPIFNFADICAVCGAGLLMIMVIVDEIRERKRKKQAAAKSPETVDGDDGKS